MIVLPGYPEALGVRPPGAPAGLRSGRLRAAPAARGRPRPATGHLGPAALRTDWAFRPEVRLSGHPGTHAG